LISADNLLRCAADLNEEVTEQEVIDMIKMGDRDGKGGVDHGDFLALMREVGLIPSEKDKEKKRQAQAAMNTVGPAGEPAHNCTSEPQLALPAPHPVASQGVKLDQ
jgi:hypothetical protein